GASSSTVRDLFSYMKSLDLLLHYPHDTICPGQGPVDPPPRGAQLVRWYQQHREEREQQIGAALAKGITGVKEIPRDVYPRNLRQGVRAAAERNVVTHLEKLTKEARVTQTPSHYALRG